MLSRRHFLQLASITVASVSLPNLTHLPLNPAATPKPAPALETVYGRAFKTTHVYADPTVASPITDRLWANTVAPIVEAKDDWYRLPQGYTLREQMQPMIAPARRSDMNFQPPFWAEVSGAIAVIRESCDARAEIIRQIGHGGILRVIDWLPGDGDGLDWYAVSNEASDDQALFGWTQASAWSPVEEEALSPNLTVTVDTHSQQLSVRDTNDHLLLTAPVSTGTHLRTGSFTVSERRISQSKYLAAEPLWLTFGGFNLGGVYWHNQFGKPYPVTSLGVQVTPPLARWLYPRAERVIIY